MKNNKNKLNPHFFRKMSNGLDIALMFYKTRLNPQQTQKGNTLLIGIGFGLLVMLLGGLAIAKANNNKINATSNEKAAQAQAVTDAGATRMMAFLGKNPKYAEYGKMNTIWSQVSSSGTSTTQSYKSNEDAACTAILAKNGVDVNSLSNVDLTGIIGKNAINSSNLKQGGFEIQSYELLSYDKTTPVDKSTVAEYEAKINDLKDEVAVGDPFAFGIFQVQGEINPNATDQASIFGKENTSKNKIQITIPLIKPDPNLVPFPGLWLGEQDPISGTNQKIDAHTMMSSSDCSNLTLDIIAGRSAIISDQQFPSLPDRPTVHDPNNGVYTQFIVPGNGSNPDTTYDHTNYALGSESITLPILGTKDGDGEPNGDGVYHYSVGSISIGGGKTITITPGKKVYLYVDGNIDMSGGKGIDYDCTGSCKIEDFRIYGYGSSGTITVNGGPTSKGFIFAPNYTVGVAGGGSPDDPNFTGSIWAKGIDDVSKSNKIIIEQGNLSWNAFPDSYQPQNLPAQIDSVSGIERLNAD